MAPSCWTKRGRQRLTNLSSVADDSGDEGSSSSDEMGAEDAEESDNFGVDALPRDRRSLEEELARIREMETRIEAETAHDLVLGCEMLAATRQQRVAVAHASLDRRMANAKKVFEYAGEQARETYTRRCAELQKEMEGDIDRELRRLQSAKDGVSVTSRRRRAVKGDARDGGWSAKGSQSNGNGLRRRRTMYGSDDAEENAPDDVFFASASPAERAQRLQFQEKKRLERLLARSSVFKPVVRQVTPEEIAEDLRTIRSSIPVGEGDSMRPLSSVEVPVVKAKQQKKRPGRRRPMIITRRRIPRAPGRIGTPLSTPLPSIRRDAAVERRRPRLQYNPTMLQEGQEVQVYRRQRRQTSVGDVAEEEEECVLSGIITAATATQVYLLTATGRFEAFDVRDCVLGLLSVHPVDDSSPKTRLQDPKALGDR
ncbi:hypothetical protein BBJ28_00003774 [Nothophytophthora sp. Chile5]|nr:hypothetical protein BBJ28_00003774 [Nothophytophthora sp. Chile5]